MQKLNIQKTKSFIIYFLIYAGGIELLFPITNFYIKLFQCLIIFFVLIFLFFKLEIMLEKKLLTSLFFLITSFGIMLFSVIYTPNIEGAGIRIYSMLSTMVFMFLLLILSQSLDERYIDLLETYIIVCNTFLLCLFFFINYKDVISGLQVGLRLGDTVGNPIWVSRLCGDTLLCFCFKYHRKKRVSYIVGILIVGIIDLLTISKGPMIAIFIAYIFYLNKVGKTKKQKMYLNISILILLSVIWGLFYLVGDSSLRYKLSVSIAFDILPGSRVDRYLYTLLEIPDSLFLGYGLGSWPQFYWNQYSYMIDNKSPEFIIGYPHNILLEIAFESGIIVLLFFTISFLFFLNKSEKNRLYTLDIKTLFIANFVYAMFSGSVTDGNRGFYYMMAIFIGFMSNNSSHFFIKSNTNRKSV